MNANEISPTISTSTLSRVRSVLRQFDRSRNLLSLATLEVRNLLRDIDEENQHWVVMVSADESGEGK